MLQKLSLPFFLIIVLLFSLKYCCPKDSDYLIVSLNTEKSKTSFKKYNSDTLVINKDVTIGNYFEFLDSIVFKYDSLVSYDLNEHVLVRANPWIINKLKNTDYYIMKSRDSFVNNQKQMIALPKGSYIVLPDSVFIDKLQKTFIKTHIDVNIPEYKLRIYEDSVMLYEFPIRVGRNENKYLKMAGRNVDLKTETGDGFIVGYNKNPNYYNPVNGHQYFVTRRDDEKVTKLPRIPFIETEINGIRNGQLIHPTTNPNTLGRAYSNGCIGTNEADAWVIYYYAPIGTKIHIRYDLNVVDKNGNKVILKDIYGYKL
ncbi:L,D-transpeptidase [uncultured Algibacter sp.]|uniref:L,D-transpeptidase n=1 Tax=uncultured Algibacter sp. TaxID=298659 RepID=UPI00262066B9|nr:L,D-transpeptidase [uncultured Algibacter sp.]